MSLRRFYWKYIVYFVLAVLVGYILGLALASAAAAMHEGFGRIYQPELRHPKNSPIQVQPASNAVVVAGWNGLVDRLALRHFDHRGYPYQDSVEMFLQTFVTPYPNGVVQKQTLAKLYDIGYYVIRVVLPQLDQEKAPTSWPPVVWSTNADSILSDASLFGNGSGWGGLANLFGHGDDDDASNGNGGTSSADGSNGAKGGASSSSSSSSSSSDPATCGTKDPCGGKQECPSSCIEVTLMALSKKPPAPAPTATSASDMSNFSRNLTADELGQWWSLFTDGTSELDGGSSSSSGSSRKKRGKRALAAPTFHQKVKAPFQPDLDKFLNQQIQTYFDANGNPTQVFSVWISSQSGPPMDEFHQNKSADMIYYVLENLVSGFPTITKPSFDFTWNTVLRLSARQF
jgi:hypothetical protein